MNLILKLKAFYREAYLLGHFPSILQLIFTPKKILGYYGFLGDKNFGDELVFESARKLFAPDILFPLKKRMPIFHMLYFHFFKERIAGVVIGGGTLVGSNFYYYNKYFRHLIRVGKPLYFHGTGVGDAPNMAPGWKTLFTTKRFGGIRGPLSKSKLEKLEIGSAIVGDAAFVMFKENQNARDRSNNQKVLINLGSHHSFAGEENSRKEINKFIEYLIKNSFQILFLPFHRIDVKLGLALKSTYSEIELLEVPENYSDACKIFEDCRFAVGERLHFGIMAALAGCSFRSINYSCKHEDFLASLNLLGWGFNPQSLSFEKLLNAFVASNYCYHSINIQINYFKRLQLHEKENFTNIIDYRAYFTLPLKKIQ